MPESIYEKIFSIDESGYFHFLSSEEPISNYKVIISAYNGEKWSYISNEYQFDVTYSLPY